MSDSLSSVLKRCLNMIEASTLGDRLFDGEVHISTLNGGLVAVIDDTRGESTTSLVPQEDSEESDQDLSVIEIPQEKEDSTSSSSQQAAEAQPSRKRKRQNDDEGRRDSWGLCPVCWDTPSEMRKAGKHMVAAKCGHLLCTHCMQAVLAAQRRCPQCRKYIKAGLIRSIYC